MSTKLLSFDANPSDFTKQKNYFDLLSIEDLKERLKNSRGTEGKPVRLIVQGHNVLVAKYGLGCDKHRDKCIYDELRNMRAIQEAGLDHITPHIVSLKWGYQDITDGHSILCCEYVRPINSVCTLRDLVKSGCEDKIWREALFQVLYTLLCLQKKFKGFRHNDFKADNILVTSPPCPSASYAIDARKCSDFLEPLRLRRVWNLEEAAVWIKIIDFEIASQTPDCAETNAEKDAESTGGKERAVMAPRLNSNVINDPGELEEKYGLSSVFSSLFDVHLMAYDVLDSALVRGIGGKENGMRHKFYDFITSFIPPKYFLKENLTSNYRLKVADQIILETVCKNSVVLEMLSHPYFYFMRGDAHECVEYELKYC